MISVIKALSQVIENTKEVCSEQVSVKEALGRVLADDVVARLNQPWAAVSAMDGYAVRAQDLIPLPARLHVIGESPAGGCFAGTVGVGQTVRIFTGAPVPDGADTVIMQENVQRDGETITVDETSSVGRFVRPAGLDFKAGGVLLTAGRILTARDLGLAAAGNVPWLSVKRRPRIAIIATGDELVMPGDPLGANQVISSNSVMLGAYMTSLGAEPLDLGIAGDNEASLARLMASARQADMLVTIGGASVGDYDLVHRVLDQKGVDLGFYKVAMRPGKPLIFGHLHGTPVLGLPGNPVSVGVTSALFLKPAIQAMLGLKIAPRQNTAVLGAGVGENDHRQDYLRATLSDANVATPFAKQDSAMLATFAAADCLIVRAPNAPAARVGDTVDVIVL